VKLLYSKDTNFKTKMDLPKNTEGLLYFGVLENIFKRKRMLSTPRQDERCNNFLAITANNFYQIKFGIDGQTI